MEDFTYGRRLSRNGDIPKISAIKGRLQRLEEKRIQRNNLKTLYEKKAASVCGNRDPLQLEKFAKSGDTLARIPFNMEFTEIDNMEIEIEFKRTSSHGPFNFYMTMEDQLNKNQKI